ncbi:MAG: aryl-sulfate sulfotransferase [Planctomycetaceae bacterium]
MWALSGCRLLLALLIAPASADMVWADEEGNTRRRTLSVSTWQWGLDGTPRWVPSPQIPLAGRVVATTSSPADLTVEVQSGDHRWTVPVESHSRTEHDIPVLGLRPGTRYELSVSARRGDDKWPVQRLVVETPELPADFPDCQLVHASPDAMEPGLTLCSILRWENNAASVDVGWIVAFDEQGRVVWYYRLPEPGGAVRRSPRGGFGLIHGARPTGFREIDLQGNTRLQFRAVGLGIKAESSEIAVPADTFHHDVSYLPDGKVLLLSTEVRTIRGYPVSEQNLRQTADANVVGDVVLELRPDGTVAGRWPLLDLLDPIRIGFGSQDRYWDLRAYPFYFGGTRDWSHCNSVLYDDRDDALIVCLRHQDAIVKFDRKTSAVRWILGEPTGWRGDLARKVLKPAGNFSWPYHAHGINYRSEDGTLLLFDNGNCRAIPPRRPQPASASYSRAVEFQIDEESHTVRQVWSYGSRREPRFFSAFVGDADWLPQTGNVLVTDGGRLEDSRGRPLGEPPGTRQWGRILEVTRDDPAQVVFELHVAEQGSESRFGSSIYRAERISSLYTLTP